jgi:hypothetical protein
VGLHQANHWSGENMPKGMARGLEAVKINITPTMGVYRRKRADLLLQYSPRKPMETICDRAKQIKYEIESGEDHETK